MASTFLTAFGFTSPSPEAEPIFLYAGYDPQSRFNAIREASATGEFDHFMTGSSAGFSLIGVFVAPAKDPAQITADEAPADEAPADEAPADEAPADEAPADEAPADEAPNKHKQKKSK